MVSKYHGRSTRSFKALRLRVLESSNICWLCNQPGADTVDHIVPRSVAPELSEVLENLAPAHRVCNSKRGARFTEGARPFKTSRNW